jgi:hypothetical protein
MRRLKGFILALHKVSDDIKIFVQRHFSYCALSFRSAKGGEESLQTLEEGNFEMSSNFNREIYEN